VRTAASHQQKQQIQQSQGHPVSPKANGVYRVKWCTRERQFNWALAISFPFIVRFHFHFAARALGNEYLSLNAGKLQRKVKLWAGKRKIKVNKYKKGKNEKLP